MGSGASVCADHQEPSALLLSNEVTEAELTRLLSPEAWGRVEDAGVTAWLRLKQEQKALSNRDSSTVTWQDLKDAYPELWLELSGTHSSSGALSGCGGNASPDAASLPPIRVIDFEDFCIESELPRFPERKELCVTLDSIDRASSFVVFISHCWLRGWSGAEGWNGRPHPDNVSHEKFKLCVQGIRKAWEMWAPGMPRCFVWLDFGCMDQDGNPAGELKQLDEIVRMSDCIFTPVYGVAEFPDVLNDYYKDYSLAAWNAPRFGYTSRGWCRVEMFYASNIPYDPGADRLPSLRHGLHHHASQGRRAHLLFGSLEASQGRLPLILPPLQNSYYENLDPAQGHVTVESDKLKIKELVEALAPYMHRTEAGYDGDIVDGKRHGHGTYRYATGNTYEGGWENNKKHGHGIFRYIDGDVYEGDWEHDRMHGRGTHRHASGAVYEGDFRNDYMHGHGTYRYVSGNVYEGGWDHDEKHGVGTLRFADGDVYEGGWRNDKKHGYGTHRFVSGASYDGGYLDDKKHGHGTYRYVSGAMYEGNWENDKKHGVGTFSFTDGNSYEGDWNYDQRHGQGVLRFANGLLFSGTFVDNKMIEGVIVIPADKEYRASFEVCAEQKHNGYMVYRAVLRDATDGSVYREGWFSNGDFIDV
jgi:hypothetical protein